MNQHNDVIAAFGTMTERFDILQSSFKQYLLRPNDPDALLTMERANFALIDAHRELQQALFDLHLKRLAGGEPLADGPDSD